MERRGAQAGISQVGGQNLHLEPEVLRPGRAGQAVGVAIDPKVRRIDAAVQHAADFVRRQLAETALGEDQRRQRLRVRPVSGQAKFADAGADADEDLLVAEVSRLDGQADAVAEGDDSRAQFRDFAAVLDSAGRAEAGIGPVKRGLRRGGGHRNLTRGFERRRDGGFAALDFNRRDDEGQRAAAFEHWLQGLVHPGCGEAFDRGVEQIEVGLGRREDALVIDGADEAVGQGRRAAGGGAGHGVLQRRPGLGDLALQLGLGYAELHQAALLLLDRLQRPLPFSRIELGGHRGDVQALGEGRLSPAGGDEGRVIRAGDLAQTTVQHGDPEIAQQVVPPLDYGVRIGIGRLDPVQLDRRLDAGLDQNAGLGIAGRDRTQVGLRPFRALGLPALECGADFRFHVRNVEVADGDHRRAGRTVVRLIEFDEALARGGADDLQIADRKALRNPLAGGEQGQLGLYGAEPGRVAKPFLADDDAALGVDGLGRHQRLRDLFAHNPQAGLDSLIVGPGKLQHIDGLVESGGSVGVGPEGQTQPLQNAQKVVLRDVGRPVEGHVFHEVGQAELVFILHQGAGVDAQAQRGLARRGGVAHDGVAHSVGHLAEAHVRVGGHVAGALGPRFVRLRLGEGRRGCGQHRHGRGGEEEQTTGGTHVRASFRWARKLPLGAAPDKFQGRDPGPPTPLTTFQRHGTAAQVTED